MKYYIYDKKTKEFIKEIDCKPGRIPAFSTEIKPPDSEKRLIFSGNIWEEKTEKQYIEYLVEIGEKVISKNQKIGLNGEVIPKTEEELSQEGLISLESLKDNKKNELSYLAKKEITSGFEFEGFLFDSTLEDQFNIKFEADSDLDSEIRCLRISDNVKDFYPFTNAKIKEIVNVFGKHKKKVLKNYSDKKKLVQEATTALEVFSI